MRCTYKYKDTHTLTGTGLTWCDTWSWFMRCRISLQLSEAPLEMGKRRDAAAWTLLRFLGGSPGGSEVRFSCRLGLEVVGLLVAVGSAGGSEGVSSVESVMSASSQADSTVESQAPSLEGSGGLSAEEAESLEGSEVSFLRQEAWCFHRSARRKKPRQRGHGK